MWEASETMPAIQWIGQQQTFKLGNWSASRWYKWFVKEKVGKSGEGAVLNSCVSTLLTYWSPGAAKYCKVQVGLVKLYSRRATSRNLRQTNLYRSKVDMFTKQ